MKTDLRIRPMRLDDLDRVLDIERKCYPEPWTRAMFEHEVSQNHLSVFFTLEENDTIIGYGGMWIIVDDMHVTNVCIHPDKQGKGYSKQLMYALFEQARRAGCKRSTLEVRESNTPAISLYKKLGYKIVGKRKNYYKNEDAIVMWLDDLDNLPEPSIEVEYVNFPDYNK